MEIEESVCKPKIFEQVYNAHSKNLYNFMYYRCGDIAKSEDFVQESFVKLWANCSKVIFSKVKSYLFTMANNMFLNSVAHAKVVLNHQKLNVKNYTHEDPQYVLEEAEFLKKLQNAIADLPEKQRVVFLLSRIEKKKYKEISDDLGISVKAVEKRMSLALKTLKNQIKEI